MTAQEQLAEEFETHRDHLRAVAYRMLGSVTEADDAVQEAWLRLARTDASEVENMRAWLTTVVSRISLDLLRWRKSRREDSLETHLPDPVVTPLDADPEAATEQADSVTLALLVVLEELNPRERMSFVLHDMFGVPFDEIAPIVGRSPAAATQLASRARRRVRTASPAVADLATQRRVLDAFTDASRRGDFDALVAVLDPDVTLRGDLGPDQPSVLVHGAHEVATRARLFAQTGIEPTYVLVNGAVGVLSRRDGQPVAVFSPVIRGERIVEINVLADPARLAQLDLPDLNAF